MKGEKCEIKTDALPLYTHTQAELGVEGPKKTSCAIRNVKGEIWNDKPKRRKEGLMQVSKRAPYMQTNAFYWWKHMLVINVFPSRLKSGGMWKKKAGMQIQLVYGYSLLYHMYSVSCKKVAVINNLAISEH